MKNRFPHKERHLIYNRICPLTVDQQHQRIVYLLRIIQKAAVNHSKNRHEAKIQPIIDLRNRLKINK